MKNRELNSIKKPLRLVSLSTLFTIVVTVIILVTSLLSLWTFTEMYRGAMEQNAVTSSEQSIAQVENTVTNYIEDMNVAMDMIQTGVEQGKYTAKSTIEKIMEVRSDAVVVTAYDLDGKLLKCWSNGQKLKEQAVREPSQIPESGEAQESGPLNISSPHVESLLVDYYPWVVTMSRYMSGENGQQIQMEIDILFDKIADYVDNVGIGQHGYCYIGDADGNIIYHPQQQLIYSGLKSEELTGLSDGVYIETNAIYTVRSLENCEWYIVGVCYVDEMITSRVYRVVKSLLLILGVVLLGTFLAGRIFSGLFSKPARQLTKAMRGFEQNADDFVFRPVSGTKEITALSDSFEHMVMRLKELMEQVRQEEISLRKTELNALQAQINPHFLYNTLDAIAWLCEEERNKDAVEMVNALARLFRISISKGHELITIEKEVQHARSYLQIQKFRYKNQFNYHFDVDEACLPYYCNKITLQPIIENAICHGLNVMVDEGCIRIGIHMDGEDIVFSVEDNGVGMTQEECARILQEGPSDRTGIGIKNVNDRVRIYFGAQYGVRIYSEPDVGTRVTIRMPKVTGRDHEGK